MNSSEFAWFLHDVATPLTTAEGVLTYILQQFPTPTGTFAQSIALLDTSLSCIRHVNAMVAEERLSSSKKQGLSCVLLPQLQAVCQTLAPLAERHHITLTLHQTAQDISVCGQRTYILRVLQNLVLNAIEAIAKKNTALPRQVDVMVTNTPAWVQVTISDTGPGISPAPLTQKTQGRGSGLTATRHLLEHRLGGHLTLTPRPQGGTRAECWFLPGNVLYYTPVPKDSVQKDTFSL